MGRETSGPLKERNNAERAVMVAALGNLEIGIVFRCQKNAARRHQVPERLVQSGKIFMNETEHFFGLLRTCDSEEFRETQSNEVAFFGIFSAQAARHNNFAIFT